MERVDYIHLMHSSAVHTLMACQEEARL